jgi:hypothetical protein
MLYPEFCKYKSFVDPQNPLVNAYENKAGDRFYIEPGFYMGLQGFAEKRAKDLPTIMMPVQIQACEVLVVSKPSLKNCLKVALISLL